MKCPRCHPALGNTLQETGWGPPHARWVCKQCRPATYWDDNLNPMPKPMADTEKVNEVQTWVEVLNGHIGV